jgi:hypothetical protein
VTSIEFWREWTTNGPQISWESIENWGANIPGRSPSNQIQVRRNRYHVLTAVPLTCVPVECSDKGNAMRVDFHLQKDHFDNDKERVAIRARTQQSSVFNLLELFKKIENLVASGDWTIAATLCAWDSEKPAEEIVGYRFLWRAASLKCRYSKAIGPRSVSFQWTACASERVSHRDANCQPWNCRSCFPGFV